MKDSIIPALDASDADKGKKLCSSFYPLLLILLTLNFTTARDSLNLVRHRVTVRNANIQAIERLQQTSLKAAFVDKMKTELTDLAKTDPVAARVLSEYFPPSPTPAPTATAPASPTLPTLAPGLAPPAN